MDSEIGMNQQTWITLRSALMLWFVAAAPLVAMMTAEGRKKQTPGPALPPVASAQAASPDLQANIAPPEMHAPSHVTTPPHVTAQAEIPAGRIAGRRELPEPAHAAAVSQTRVVPAGHRVATNWPRPDGSDGRFRRIETRLRELGASYYRLDFFRDEPRTFEFQCWISAAGEEQFTRRFQAADPDPLAAMQSVLADVEAWRRGRLR